MYHTLLDATWRVEKMIGRQDDLKRIKDAIFAKVSEPCCRVVLVTGPGGIGKSRLLEEVQVRLGHTLPQRKPNTDWGIPYSYSDDTTSNITSVETWANRGAITISDAIDLTDVRLSARTQVLQAIRDALSRRDGVDFSGYENAMRAYLRSVENSASFQTIRSLSDEAEKAFWLAIQKHTRTKRLVLILDTAERLVLRSSAWSIENELLTTDEMVISSQQWLLNQLQQGKFTNTTIILAGRDGKNEGGPFFDQLRSILKEQTVSCELIEVPLQPLSEKDTITYFQCLADEWEERTQIIDRRTHTDYGEQMRIRWSMRGLAEDTDRLQVLHLITAGMPVLLSLYGDIIHETDKLPEPLTLTKTQIVARLQQDSREILQAEIERSFIHLLFQQPDLRSKIMKAMARCPAGLDAAQLHFIIDSKDMNDLSKWQPTPQRVVEIEQHLERIRKLSITRLRPYNRLGLQDEIYRIYAQRMSDSVELRTVEHKERINQYQKLVNWANWELKRLTARRLQFLAEDERRLARSIHSPTMSLRPRIPSPTPSEQDERSQVLANIRDWELERLHYSLLRGPASGLNDDYTDLAEQRWLTNNEEADFVAQQEMWRVLHDHYALRFTKITDERLHVLKLAAKHEDPARWIKRFILRREYNRAISFYNSVEATISNEPDDERIKWQHSLNSGERRLWRDYAQVMIGKNVHETVKNLEQTLSNLIKLANSTQDQAVGPNGETGFKDHDALPRLLRIIAVGYNFAGYGHTAPLGQYWHGVRCYGISLNIMRQVKFEAQQAGTRNNLARALSSLGREERGYLVCVDALNLRRNLGAEIPIAYSLNTLALIGNSMQGPSTWKEAAQAAAIFRRLGDNRGLGLALIQLGIGLRRLANSSSPGVILDDTPEEIYTTAQDALGEAVDIFRDDPEVLRLVEATLELGCVQRDQLKFIDRGSTVSYQRMIRFSQDAEMNFDKAIELADEHGFVYLALQASVDLAWLYFFTKEYKRAEEASRQAEHRIPVYYRLDKPIGDSEPSTPTTETHHYYQGAKLQGLKAAIAMDRFKARREKLRIAAESGSSLYSSLQKDGSAKRFLNESAASYVLSLYYGQMYSPRSRSLATTFNQIYNHIKGFNTVEYEMFFAAQRSAAKKYRTLSQKRTLNEGSRKPYDFSNLEGWLIDCFGPLEVKDE